LTESESETETEKKIESISCRPRAASRPRLCSLYYPLGHHIDVLVTA
jgi:hypothetical protein